MLRSIFQPALAVALATSLAGCPFQPEVEAFGGQAMGSTYSIKYVPAAGAPGMAELKAETEAMLADLDRHVSTYRPDSDLELFNELPAGACRKMPADVLELIAASAQLAVEGEGTLDPTLEPLLNLWGFGAHGEGDRVPSAEEIEQARALTGLRHLHTRNGELCKDVALQLSFNSIAAGYVIDRVSEMLVGHGIDSHLVEITGELRAQGLKPDGSHWRIAIEAPVEGVRAAQRVVELDGLAVSTSGDYRNYFERDGKRYSHTLDPATGAPITHSLAAVTVIDPSALRADGLSTVLMVMGTERGYAFAQAHGIAAFFVDRTADGFESLSSDAFIERFGTGEGE